MAGEIVAHMEYLDKWIASLKVAGYTKNTLKAYNLDVHQFFIQCDKKTKKVKRSDAQEFLAFKIEQGNKPATINRTLAGIKSYFNFVEDLGKLKENPTNKLKSSKLPKVMPKFLTEAELNLLLDTAKKRSNPRLYAAMSILYSTGARINEFCDLQKSDFNFETGKVRIRNGKGNKERETYLTAQGKEALLFYWKSRDDDSPYAFVSERTPKGGVKRVINSSLQRQLREFGKECGIEQRVHAHLFRKTLASHLIQRGADILLVSQILGHADVSTTQRYTCLLDQHRHSTFTDLIDNKMPIAA
jgi:integrase/recombinase XerD